MNTNIQIKTRFAPSPTGLLHLGNIRTALFNALLSQRMQGDFLLRIEDTDKERSKKEYTNQLMEDMQWLGLNWQEGPYWQSERQPIYDNYYQILLDAGLAYRCFCSEQQLALTRKIQLSQGKAPRYAGTCRNLTADQIEEKFAQGIKPTLRFAVPANIDVAFEDLVRGEQHFKSNDLGDFIIRRMDGSAPFLFCNVIDDALMKVTQALRGEDHLTNTPRQVLVAQALGLMAPQYGHINLIVGPDGTPLSKRHGSRSINELRQEGFLPLGIVNYLARLGHYYENDKFMTLQELAENFSIKSLGRAPAKFDYQQLLYWQKEAVMRLSNEEFWNWLGENLQKKIPQSAKNEFINAIRSNVTFPKEVGNWINIFYEDQLNFDEQQIQILKDSGKDFFSAAIKSIENQGADFTRVGADISAQLSIKGKMLFQPLRVALTAHLHGPEMVKVFELLGKEKIITRLKNAQILASSNL